MVLASVLLSGCTTSPALKVQRADMQPDSIRTAIAKIVLRSPYSGSVSLFKAKVVNARIGPAIQSGPGLFADHPHVFYCVYGEIENPLFPLNQPFYAHVRIIAQNQRPEIRVSTSRTKACSTDGGGPFPELEALSLER